MRVRTRNPAATSVTCRLVVGREHTNWPLTAPLLRFFFSGCDHGTPHDDSHHGEDGEQDPADWEGGTSGCGNPKSSRRFGFGTRRLTLAGCVLVRANLQANSPEMALDSALGREGRESIRIPNIDNRPPENDMSSPTAPQRPIKRKGGRRLWGRKR